MSDIEKGFDALIERMETVEEEQQELTGEIREKEVALLCRMVRDAAQLIPRIGLTMLEKGKQEPDGTIFDPTYYPEKMVVLGTTEPLAYRPDDVTRTVDHQICALSEDGRLFEVMYSSNGFIIDSYRQPLECDEAFEIYGYELMVMLYRALKDYLENEEELVNALRITLDYIGS
ncbi:MAG: hypothetical protein ACP5C4_05065 [Methanomicrobiales archaeon]